MSDRDIWWARQFCDDHWVDSRMRDKMAERLAELFAADQVERTRAIADAVANERERCARIVFEASGLHNDDAEALASAVRATPAVRQSAESGRVSQEALDWAAEEAKRIEDYKAANPNWADECTPLEEFRRKYGR